MPPTTQAATNTNINNAYQQGQQLQNQYNTQSAQDQGQYQTAYGNANQAQSALTGFTGHMINGNQLYGQNLTGAQQMYGFDPRQLLVANRNLAQTQDVLNNLPQAISQQGNYSGATAGAIAGNYANSAQNINGVLGNQTNAVNAYQNVLAATQNQANQQTGQALTGQGQQLQAYTAAAQNATGIMNNALTVMNNIEQLAQQQGTATANQIAAYQNAYNAYISAQAQASIAQAQTSEANSAAGQLALAQQKQTTQARPPAAPAPSTTGSLSNGLKNVVNSFSQPGVYSPSNIYHTFAPTVGRIGGDIGNFMNGVSLFGGL